MAVVVGAGRLKRRREAVEAHFLEARRVEREVFESATHVLATDDFLSSDLLGLGDRLGSEHRIEDAAIIKNLAELSGRRLALAGVDDLSS